MDPTIFLAGAPHRRGCLGYPMIAQGSVADSLGSTATTLGGSAMDESVQDFPETHAFMTKNSVLLPGHPAPNYGANLQRGCESVSPFGVPPLICGRPFKEAIAAPSLLTGLGLDSSKRLLCSRQRPRGRGAPSSASTKLPPLAPGNELTSSSPFMDGKLGDPFFVTGGGSSGIHPIGTEVEAGAGLANDLKSCDTSDHKRPRSTPLPLPSNRGNFFSSGSEEYTLSARRDVRTADDANCLGHRRLCFRSEPIHDLHVATLKTIDPTGIYGMYQEWSNIKNRVLSRGFAEQRSDLALYDRLRKEAEDDKASSDNDASIDNAVVASGTNSMEEAYRTRSPSSGVAPCANGPGWFICFLREFDENSKHTTNNGFVNGLKELKLWLFCAGKVTKKFKNGMDVLVARPPDHHRIPERVNV